MLATLMLHANWGMFALAASEAVFFPLGAEALALTLFLTEPAAAYQVATWAALGGLFGALMAYALGYFGLRPWLMSAFGEKFARLEQVVRRFGAAAMALSGITPLPFKLFTWLGGATGMSPGRFAVAAIVNRALRFYLLAWLFARGVLAAASPSLWTMVGAACLILGVLACLWPLPLRQQS